MKLGGGDEEAIVNLWYLIRYVECLFTRVTVYGDLLFGCLGQIMDKGKEHLGAASIVFEVKLLVFLSLQRL